MAAADPTRPPTDVAVVSADPAWSDGLVSAHLGSPVRAYAGLDEAIATIGERPTVVVLRLPDDADALDAARDIGGKHPTLAVVLVVRTLDVSLLREAMLAGVADVVEDVSPGDEVLWSEIVATAERLAARTGPQGHPPGRIVLCTAAAGMQGASMTAANLAVALAAHHDRRVILLEGDHRFGDLRELMGLLGSRSGGPTTDERYAGTWLAPYLHRHEASDVTVLLPPQSSTSLEDFPPSMVVEALGLLQTMSDVIVVDAPFWITEGYRVHAWSDLTLLVTRDAPRHLAKARIAGRVLAPYAPTTRLVISNYVNGRTPKRAHLAEEIGFETIARIPEADGLDAHVTEGVPAVLADPTSAYATGIEELATAVLSWTGAAAGPLAGD